MLKRYKRPLNNKERRCLNIALCHFQGRLSAPLWRHAVAMLIIFGPLWGLTMWFSDAHWTVITLFWLVVGSGISLWCFLSERKSLLKNIAAIKTEIDRNEAEAIHIKSDKMVIIEEVEEEEEASYAYQVNDNQWIIISGRFFSPSARFPNDDFELVHFFNDEGQCTGALINKYGNKLKPLRSIPYQTLKGLAVPDHLQVIDGTLEDLEKILRKEVA